MTLLEYMLQESVSSNEVIDAIDNHERVIITYEGDDGTHNGPRVIEVYAYGLTSAGNPVIRTFEPVGDTKTVVPRFKYMRLDRISSWKKTGQKFSKPANFYYKGVGDFNPNGDKTMSTVYKIAQFGNEEPKEAPESSPKMKDGKPKQQVFKTDTENGLERLRQQLANPIKLSDLKLKNGFDGTQETPQPQSGPKLKQHSDRRQPSGMSHYYWQNRDKSGRWSKGYRDYVDKTDDSDEIEQYLNTDHGHAKELDDLRKRLGDTSKPIPFAELKRRLENNNTDS